MDLGLCTIFFFFYTVDRIAQVQVQVQVQVSLSLAVASQYNTLLTEFRHKITSYCEILYTLRQIENLLHCTATKSRKYTVCEIMDCRYLITSLAFSNLLLNH